MPGPTMPGTGPGRKRRAEKCGATLVYEKACPCPATMPHVEICCGEQMKPAQKPAAAAAAR